MKKILFAVFVGLCIFGTLIVDSNSSKASYSSRQYLPGIILGDTTPPKPDTAKLESSRLAFSNQALRDTTPTKPDTSKLVAYSR